MSILTKLLCTLCLCLAGSSLLAQSVTLEPIKDNTLFESATGALSNGAGEWIFAGNTNQGDKRRALLQFDIASNVPAGATITGATLTLTMDMTIAGTTPMSLHALQANWGEGASLASGQQGGGGAAQTGDATWLHTSFSTSFWTLPGGDFVATPSATASVTGNGSYSWTSAQLATDVQAWLSSPSANFGWILLGDESTTPSAKRFASREFATPSARPSLAITYTLPCTPPDLPVFLTLDSSICIGFTAFLYIPTGELNDATAWHLYADSCGGTSLQSSPLGFFFVDPTVNTTYFIRGEGGCTTPGDCESLTITVNPIEDASFSYPATEICQGEPDLLPMITGVSGGLFNSSPSGLSIGVTSGAINLSASLPKSYKVTYTTLGDCWNSSVQSVTVFPSYDLTPTVTLCDGDSLIFDSQVIKVAGVYNASFLSKDGCDSTVVLTVTQTLLDTSVIRVDDNTLRSDAAGVTFQWVLCDAGTAEPVIGAVSDTFNAAVAGNYAVVVTSGTCQDTSACFPLIGRGQSIDEAFLSAIRLYPNPTQGDLRVDLGERYQRIEVQVLNLQGQVVLQSTAAHAQEFSLSLQGLPAGLYLLRLSADDRQAVKRVSKE